MRKHIKIALTIIISIGFIIYSVIRANQVEINSQEYIFGYLRLSIIFAVVNGILLLHSVLNFDNLVIEFNKKVKENILNYVAVLAFIAAVTVNFNYIYDFEFVVSFFMIVGVAFTAYALFFLTTYWEINEEGIRSKILKKKFFTYEEIRELKFNTSMNALVVVSKDNQKMYIDIVSKGFISFYKQLITFLEPHQYADSLKKMKNFYSIFFQLYNLKVIREINVD